MFINNKLSENLKTYRKAKNMSQSELAQLLNISSQSISKWECGTAFPDVEKLCFLSEIFNVTIDTLIGHENNQMKIMIAVDGGGTKTEFVMFSEDGVIIEHQKLGPCNPNSIGIENSAKTLIQGIDNLLNTCANVSAVYIGAAGFLLGNNASKVLSLLTKKYPNIKIKCATDILNVIPSANIDEDCIAVICGTGSSVLVKNKDSLKTVEGWGYLIGKKGSGFDIGRDAIYSALAHTEGLGKPTKITELILSKTEKTVYGLLEEVYKESPSFIASFAPIVFDAYRSGDEVAKEILESNAKHLAFVINHAYRNYSNGNKVVLSGGLFINNDMFVELVSKYLDKNLQALVPIYPQIYGASILCAQICGVDTTNLKNNFMNSYNRKRS